MMERVLCALVLCVVTCGEICAATVPCQYEMTSDSALYGENLEVIRDTTLTACKEQCDMLENCLSLDFNSYTSSCFLSDHNRESSPDMFGKHHQMDYYEKTSCDETTTDGTDDDCPTGYSRSNGSCYRFEIDQGRTWHTAREQCQAEGADLASVNSQLEMDYLEQTIKDVLSAADQSYYHELWWVGARTLTVGAVHTYSAYMWVDGTALPSDDPLWYPGEPNSPDETNVCILLMDGIAGLNDLHEDAILRYICEYKEETGGETDGGDNGVDDNGSGGGYSYEYDAE